MVMNTKKKKILLTVLLLLALGNYARMTGTEDIRTIEFLSIFAIGAISALLINVVFGKENEE
jgi:uncharacterized membrane protein